MTSQQVGKMMTIGAMYMAQTFSAGFIAQLLPAVYRERGLPLEQFWVFSVCLAPLALRFLWAPVVDRYGHGLIGHRRSWLIPCTALAAMLFLALGLLDPTVERLPFVALVVFVIAVVLATQEIAVDGYFVENLAPGERGLGSGVRGYMEAFAELGALAGLAAIYHRWGWGAAVGTASVLLVVFTLPGMVRKETPQVLRKPEVAGQASLGAFLRRRDSRFIVPVLMGLGLALGMYFSMLGAFLIDKGFAVDQTGLVLGVCVVIGWLVGGPVAIRFVERVGVRGALAALLLATPVSFATAVWLAGVQRQGVYVTIAALSPPTLVLAQLTIVSYVARLGWCSQAQAGTDFATQGAAVRLGVAAAVGIGGAVAAWVGWRAFFVLYAAYATVATLWFFAIERKVAVLVAQRNRADGIVHGECAMESTS